jgi:hypothetical protein
MYSKRPLVSAEQCYFSAYSFLVGHAAHIVVRVFIDHGKG